MQDKQRFWVSRDSNPNNPEIVKLWRRKPTIDKIYGGYRPRMRWICENGIKMSTEQCPVKIEPGECIEVEIVRVDPPNVTAPPSSARP